MDQLMLRVFPISLTRAASRWLRNEPTGLIKTWEDLKTKFLNKYCPPSQTAKKIEEINNFQQELDETIYQAWEHFKELLMKYPQHYLTKMQEVILFYNRLDVSTQQILGLRGAIPTMTAVDAKKTIQEMAEYSQKWHNETSRGRSTETSDGLAAIQAHLNNIGRDIKKVNKKVYATQVGFKQCKGPHYTKDCPLKEEGKTIEEAYYTQFGRPFQGGGYRATTPIFYQRNNADPSNQGASIKSLEIQIGKMSKVLQERGFGSLPSSTETNSRDQFKSILTILEANSHSLHRIGSPQYAVSTGQNRKKGSYGPQFLKAYSKASHIDESMPQKEKDPGSFTLPCYINNICLDNARVDLGASVSVMPFLTYLNLGLGKLAHIKLTVELADRTVKYPKGIAKNGTSKNCCPVGVICDELDNTWAWVALGRERQADVVAGAPEATEGALDVDEGAQAVPIPVQRRVKRRTGEASTSAAPLDEDQLDP
ncbi:hypothetical protein Tco_1214361 [Tanacetum coccineum]